MGHLPAAAGGGAAVTAVDFGLKGPRGWVFRGVHLDAAPGSLIAVEGPSGSGRTCLLLALTGRMKATHGHAEVAGHRLPKHLTAVRKATALGPVPGVTDLDQALTVAEQLREAALLQRRYDGPVRALLARPAERAAATRARIDAALAAAGLDLATLPKGDRTSVRDLERLEYLRLSVAIALLGRPGLLALDDTDLKLSDAERAEVWALLRNIAAAGTTVLAVCSEAPEDAVVLRTAPASEIAAPAHAADPERAPRRRLRRPAAATAPAGPAAATAPAGPAAATAPAADQAAPAAPAATHDGATTDAETTDAETTGTDKTGTDRTGTDKTDTENTKGTDEDALAEARRA
ncbi:ATP-binding cassette domain-containing protein [Streptomyces sp. WAC06614]|uniref:ATP-binding cassette domain-containing protein n=1 Tax=Streptomyces sp. WAC06614 TaxID=2487416 RepID=UPI000F7B7029|nr:ATP-binding cassette domain-containing protein [Streptomyces sp. WAC06614]RSS81537.1 ATP-binding cassette domain-containing protein [Streptomyces sp. WAC06614]